MVRWRVVYTDKGIDNSIDYNFNELITRSDVVNKFFTDHPLIETCEVFKLEGCFTRRLKVEIVELRTE